MKEFGVGPCGFEMTEKGESDGGKSEQATEEWDTQIRGKRIKVGRGPGEVNRDVAWRNMKRVTIISNGKEIIRDDQAIYVQSIEWCGDKN